MSGLKMEAKNIKAMFVNPIIIATFAGLFIWLFQGYLPQVSVTGAEGEISQVAFLRIDQTAPWLFQPMDYLAGLSSPLAWLAIGATLGEVSFKKLHLKNFMVLQSSQSGICTCIEYRDSSSFDGNEYSTSQF